MKIKAVRLSEVGHFRSGVALEGLSGRLDVVPGPNEAGKTTIFRAIDALFRQAHSAANAEVRALQPVGGGAPYVEAEFEADGRSWRVRKRYLAAKSAMLEDLGSGQVLRGSDAEVRLSQLISGRLDAKRMLGLLWVAQRHSFDLPEPKGELGSGLQQLIEDEIADVAGEGSLRRVREAVTEALAEMVSRATRRPAANTRYKAAIDARDRAASALAEVEAAQRVAVERLAALRAAESEAAALDDPEAVTARAERLAGVDKAVNDARAAQEAVRRLVPEVAARQAAFDRAARDLADLTAGTTEAAQLEATLAVLAPALTHAVGDVDRLTTARGEAERRLQQASDQLSAAEAALEGLRLAEHRQGLQRSLATLHDRAAVAGRTAARLGEIERDLAGETLVPADVARIRAVSREIEMLELQRAAALPAIRIDYLPGAQGRIAVAGRTVADSGPLPPTAEMVLEIAGIGRITIAAPAGTTADLAAALDRGRDRLCGLLVGAGATDVAGIERRERRRQELVQARQVEVARLTAEAPDGVEDITQQLAARTAELAALPMPANGTGDRKALEAACACARANVRAIEAEIRRLADDLQAATGRRAKLAAEGEAAKARLEIVRARLPEAAIVQRAVADAEAAVATAQAALDESLRQRGAWERAVPAVQAMLDLERELAAARRAIDEVARRRQQLALDIRGLESELRRDRQDGIEAEVEDARAALGSAQSQVSAFERRLAELQLLDRVLADAAQSSLATELAPVLERLQAYVRQVLPDAAVRLGDKLLLAALEREGSVMGTGQLSIGTGEQIAVLVRLAYARLLSDRGQALPLLLDDALVYADAARFRAMMAVIEQATMHHQVIMLTCQEDRLAALGARAEVNVVAMLPWSPTGVANAPTGAAA